MKIISKCKDYYDHIGHIYECDYKIIYERDKSLNYKGNIEFRKLPYIVGDKISCIWMSYLSRYFLLVKRIDKNCKILHDWRIYDENLDKEIFDHRYNKHYFNLKGMNCWFKRKEINNHFDPYLEKVSKEVKSPIFLINSITKEIDNLLLHKISLGNIGMGKFYTPEQAYQDISFYISNVINDNADCNPPVQIDNKSKITQHGFDLKQSFRHRT